MCTKIQKYEAITSLTAREKPTRELFWNFTVKKQKLSTLFFINIFYYNTVYIYYVFNFVFNFYNYLCCLYVFITVVYFRVLVRIIVKVGGFGSPDWVLPPLQLQYKCAVMCRVIQGSGLGWVGYHQKSTFPLDMMWPHPL